MNKRITIILAIVITVLVLIALVLVRGNKVKEIIGKTEELLDQGKPEEARALLEKGVADFPKSAALHAKLGYLYFETYDALQKEPKEEVIFSHYKRAVELEPENDTYLSDLSFIYYWFGEWDEAEKAGKQAIELNRENTRAWRTLGLTYSAFRNENEKGEEVFKQMVELFPEKADGYLRLGVLYKKLGRVEESLPMYLKAVEVEPDNLYAHNLLFISFEDPDWKEVKEEIARMGLRAKPDDTLTMQECQYKGEFYTYLEKYDEVEKLYRACLEKYPRKTFSRKMVELDLQSLKWEKELREHRERVSEFKTKTSSTKENSYEAVARHRREVLSRKQKELLEIWENWKKEHIREDPHSGE